MNNMEAYELSKGYKALLYQGMIENTGFPKLVACNLTLVHNFKSLQSIQEYVTCTK